MEKSKKIAIVGGGLSALYSFFGAIDAGYFPHEIDVMVAGKSPRLGSIFMYTSPVLWKKVDVHNILWGTCPGYSHKQWKDPSIKTSAHTRFQNGEKDLVIEELYDPEGLYQTLWSRIPVIKKISVLTEADIERMKNQYKAVICTFPSFDVKQDYQKYIVNIPITFRRDSFFSPLYAVIYNGLPEVPWIRKTTMPGRIYTEYPSDFSEDIIMKFEELRDPREILEIARVPDLKPDTPPLSQEERVSDNLLRVGRQAVFDRKYLSHYAQIDTKKFLEKL